MNKDDLRVFLFFLARPRTPSAFLRFHAKMAKFAEENWTNHNTWNSWTHSFGIVRQLLDDPKNFIQ